MAFNLDLGNVVIVLQIMVLLLLLVGVRFVKSKGGTRRLLRHGLATTLALAMHMTSVFIIMIPSFYANFLLDLGGFDIVHGSIVWLHIVTGVIAPILGFLLIALWRFQPPSKMTCPSRKWLMMPTFIIWTVSLVSGIVIQLGGMI